MQPDLVLFYSLNGLHTPFLDWFMPFISDLGNFSLPLWMFGFLFFYLGKFRERLFVILTLLSVIGGDRLITDTIKEVVHRPRPFQVLRNVRVVERPDRIYYSNPPPSKEPPRGRSFPSGHAANNTAAAVMLTAIYGRGALWIWFWVLLVSYSRIYMGVHYPSDVLAGWLIALVYSYVFLYFVHWFWEKHGARLFPSLYNRYPSLPLHLPRVKKDRACPRETYFY